MLLHGEEEEVLLHGKEGMQLHGLQLSDFGVRDVQEWQTKYIREGERPGVRGVLAFYLEQLRVGYSRAPGSTDNKMSRSKKLVQQTEGEKL